MKTEIKEWIKSVKKLLTSDMMKEYKEIFKINDTPIREREERFEEMRRIAEEYYGSTYLMEEKKFLKGDRYKKDIKKLHLENPHKIQGWYGIELIDITEDETLYQLDIKLYGLNKKIKIYREIKDDTVMIDMESFKWANQRLYIKVDDMRDVQKFAGFIVRWNTDTQW